MTETPLPIPVINIAALVADATNKQTVAAQIGAACRQSGFFYITGHGVDEALQAKLESLSRQFFAAPAEQKQAIRMALGGRAWRGYFAVGEELTSGRPDCKEGLYFGEELADDHPLVQARTPMHGRNLFPAEIPEFGDTVLAYMRQMTTLGHHLMRALALSLGLAESYFAERYTGEPLTLFRIFNYPPAPPAYQDDESWGVGEHTDYGVLTILKQDDAGGLQIKSCGRWMDAPPLAGSFVCNIGDMLDRLTSGLYRSTPHRVKRSTTRHRLALPFFFDPNVNAEVRVIDIPETARLGADKDERWDNVNIHELTGAYGDYLLDKVSKVFPQLRRDVL